MSLPPPWTDRLDRRYVKEVKGKKRSVAEKKFSCTRKKYEEDMDRGGKGEEGKRENEWRGARVGARETWRVASRGVLIVAQHPREPFRLPTFLPTPSTTLSLTPCLQSPRFPVNPSPTPFTRPQTSILLQLPLLQQTSPALSLSLSRFSSVLLDSLDETPSDIHRRVSSKLIIKCIVVPVGLLLYCTPSFHPRRPMWNLFLSPSPFAWQDTVYLEFLPDALTTDLKRA